MVMMSEIPYDLRENIGKRLNTKTDVSRLRGVCKSWRSLIPPLKSGIQFLVKIEGLHCTNYTLSESIVYHLAPAPADHPDPLKMCSWLAKVQELGREDGKTHHLRMLHPLSQIINVQQVLKSLPKVFNLLDYRVLELGKVYTLTDREDGSKTYRAKAAMSLNLDFPMAMMIMKGDLFYGVLGAQNTILFQRFDKLSNYPNNVPYWGFKDVIFYQGEFYVLYYGGKLLVVDSRLDVKMVEPKRGSSANLFVWDSKMYLVESSGKLLLVRYFISDYEKEVKFNVYKLMMSEEQGQCHSQSQSQSNSPCQCQCQWEWLEMGKEALDNRMFIVADDDCLSVYTRDFMGHKFNSIYFSAGCPPTWIGAIMMDPWWRINCTHFDNILHLLESAGSQELLEEKTA